VRVGSRNAQENSFRSGAASQPVQLSKQTSVKTGVATSSTKKSLRLPKKSAVQQNYFCLRYNKEIIL